MTQRDSAPEILTRWRDMGVPLDGDREEACRQATVGAIERAMSRAQTSRKRGVWMRAGLLAAGVAISGLGALWLVPSTTETSEPSVVTAPASTRMQAIATRGATRVVRDGRSTELGESGRLELEAGDLVEVGADAKLGVTLPDSGRAVWTAAAEVRIEEVTSRRQRFDLRHGRVHISIPEDAPRRHLSVRTPHADVLVTGTVFDVRVATENGELVTDVRVQRGRVELRREGRLAVELEAGEAWSSRRTAAASRTETLEPKRKPPIARPGSAPQPAAASSLPEQNRLYRAALDARNAGDDEGAVARLTQLLNEYPASPLAQEAKVERLRALRRLGREQAASRAARRYLAEHGDGFAREEAREAALPAKD